MKAKSTMFFPESDILLKINKEYERVISILDEWLAHLRGEQAKQISPDFIRVSLKLPALELSKGLELFESVGVLRSYDMLICPVESDPIEVVNKQTDEQIFCDLCGADHFTGDLSVEQFFELISPLSDVPALNAHCEAEVDFQISISEGRWHWAKSHWKWVLGGGITSFSALGMLILAVLRLYGIGS